MPDGVSDLEGPDGRRLSVGLRSEDAC